MQHNYIMKLAAEIAKLQEKNPSDYTFSRPSMGAMYKKNKRFKMDSDYFREDDRSNRRDEIAAIKGGY